MSEIESDVLTQNGGCVRDQLNGFYINRVFDVVVISLFYLGGDRLAAAAANDGALGAGAWRAMISWSAASASRIDASDRVCAACERNQNREIYTYAIERKEWVAYC